MSTMPRLNAHKGWGRIAIVAGTIAMLVGALDPLEGSLLILPGSGLVALGAFLGTDDRRLVAYRVWVFILIAIGVGALWGLSSAGGLGGNSGRSIGWGVLILPYLIGWSMGICGPDSPRWSLVLGIVIGLWYQAILVMVLMSAGVHRGGAAIVLSALGLLTIAGCVARLRHYAPAQQHTGAAPQEG